MRRKKAYRAPEGLVKQKKSKNWYIKTRIGGKLIYKSTKTSDLRQAELILAKVKVALLSLDSQVREVIGKSISFRELIERYLSEVSPLKRSQDADITNAKPLLTYFADWKIDLITTQDIYQYQDWRKSQRTKYGTPISGSTINREVALLRHAFKKAIRIMLKNVMERKEWWCFDKKTAKEIDKAFRTALYKARNKNEG